MVVVLNACSDGSAKVAADCDVQSLVVDHACVGAARAAGMTHVLRRYGQRGVWLATTDADSVVPRHWLAAQLRHARAGARVVAGTVTVNDWTGHSPAVQDRAQRAYGTGPHRHVHGANLSFAAEAYRAAGGFRVLPCHEDVRLVDSFRANGEPVAWATDIPVVTSARRNGRAPNGFADYLLSLDKTAGAPAS